MIVAAAETGIEAFQRFEKHVYKGSGLGLATVKKAVETMGGKVWVESEVRKGTTFCIRLKVARRTGSQLRGCNRPNWPAGWSCRFCLCRWMLHFIRNREQDEHSSNDSVPAETRK